MQDANLNAGLIQATGNLMPPQDRLPPLAIHKGPQAGVEAPRQPRPTYELVAIGAGFQLGWEDVVGVLSLQRLVWKNGTRLVSCGGKTGSRWSVHFTVLVL